MATQFGTIQSLRQRLLMAAGVFARSLGDRAALLRMPTPAGVSQPPLRLLLAEMGELLPLARLRRQKTQPVPLCAEPRVVILLPGFAASPRRMRHLAFQRDRAGQTVKRWGLGRNLGPTPENMAQLRHRLRDVHLRHGQQVYLVWWSLGGLFAREIAKLEPACVAKVVTMGTPFSHTPWSNNGWRAYQLVTGHCVDAPPVAVCTAQKPPVETVALWSPRDGVVAPRSACGKPGERDRAIALRVSHMGFADDPAVIRAVLAELQ